MCDEHSDIQHQLNNAKVHFYLACCYGNLEQAQCLLTEYPNIDLNDLHNTFHWTCRNGHLKVSQWFLEIKPDIYERIDFGYTFNWTCENGHLEISQWLLKIKPNINVFTNQNLKCVFHWTCQNGHLKVAQWLLQINPNIDISAFDEIAFRSACRNGHLKVAQWLFEIKPDICVSIFGEEAFRWACHEGHLVVAQWLLEIKPDVNISACDDEAFRWACFGGHTKVAQWLQSLCPWLYKILDDKTPHINTEEEQQVCFKEERFQRRKYLVWLYDSSVLHQTSILHSLPSEMLREITMMI